MFGCGSVCVLCVVCAQQSKREALVSGLKGNCLNAGTAGGRWVRCGLCCLFERPKRVLASFLEFWGCRKGCALPQESASDFSFFLTKKQWVFWRVCQAPIVYATTLALTVSLHCDSYIDGHIILYKYVLLNKY